MTPKRDQAWPTLLSSFQRASQLRPFEYGRWDCCLAACDAVEAMTGVDPAASFRGLYSSEEGAKRLFDQYGGSLEDLVAAVAAEVGFPEITFEGESTPAPSFAQRGDLVVVQGARGQSLGFVDAAGTRVAIATDPAGLLYVPRRLATRAWRVG